MRSTALHGSILACLILGFSGPLHAEDKNNNAAKSAGSSKQIRVQVEFIDVPHEQLTELMFGDKPAANDGELRKQAGQLVKDGKATIAETMLCLARSGEKATTESIEEYIYPTEYEPAQLPSIVPPADAGSESSDKAPKTVVVAAPNGHDIATGPTPTAFQTRNLGSTMEMEATLSADNKTVDLKIVPEIVHHVGNEIWADWKGEHGDSPIQMPRFYVLRLNTSVTVATGQYMLLGAFSPKDKDGHPDRTRKLMVFVKADVTGSDR